MKKGKVVTGGRQARKLHKGSEEGLYWLIDESSCRPYNAKVGAGLVTGHWESWPQSRVLVQCLWLPLEENITH